MTDKREIFTIGPARIGSTRMAVSKLMDSGRWEQIRWFGAHDGDAFQSYMAARGWINSNATLHTGYPFIVIGQLRPESGWLTEADYDYDWRNDTNIYPRESVEVYRCPTCHKMVTDDIGSPIHRACWHKLWLEQQALYEKAASNHMPILSDTDWNAWTDDWDDEIYGQHPVRHWHTALGGSAASCDEFMPVCYDDEPEYPGPSHRTSKFQKAMDDLKIARWEESYLLKQRAEIDQKLNQWHDKITHLENSLYTAASVCSEAAPKQPALF